MENALLRQARKSKGWSQEELAEKMGVQALSVGRWERGEATPTERNCHDLCQIFAMDPQALGLLLEAKMSPPPAITRSAAPPPRPEHPSTYFVEDRSNVEELKRLAVQDELYTRQMGGVLAEQADPSRFRRVLDVGCGTGGWLIETAKTYPGIHQLIGVDISTRMVQYAREQAERAGVNDRVEFQVMDALRMLEFPNSYFDLVNQRLGMSYLRTWDWPKLLSEYKRVLQTHGTVRITESNIVLSNMPTVMDWSGRIIRAFHRAGHFPDPESESLITILPTLVERVFSHPTIVDHRFLYAPGQPGFEQFVEDGEKLIVTLKSFLQKWGTWQVQEDYETFAAAFVRELHDPNYESVSILRTVYGICTR